jgi:hypothetical protein
LVRRRTGDEGSSDEAWDLTQRLRGWRCKDFREESKFLRGRFNTAMMRGA